MCHDDDIIRSSDVTLTDVDREFFENALRGLDCLGVEMLCPIDKLVFLHRTRGDIEYLKRFGEIYVERLDA